MKEIKDCKIVGIIPVRLNSRRLPGKALIDINGLPMMVRTYNQIENSEILDDIFIATDNDDIIEVATKYTIKVIKTGDHICGTNRIAEACKDIDCDIVVNIHGDEPLIKPEHIDEIVRNMEGDVTMGITEYDRKGRPSDIKAVLDKNNNIIYCSRSDIPYGTDNLKKLCFVTAFRKSFLMEYATWEQTELEKIESNEYLRILENGRNIKTVNINNVSISVDTQEDLEEVRKIIKEST